MKSAFHIIKVKFDILGNMLIHIFVKSYMRRILPLSTLLRKTWSWSLLSQCHYQIVIVFPIMSKYFFKKFNEFAFWHKATARGWNYRLNVELYVPASLSFFLSFFLINITFWRFSGETTRNRGARDATKLPSQTRTENLVVHGQRLNY